MSEDKNKNIINSSINVQELDKNDSLQIICYNQLQIYIVLMLLGMKISLLYP